MMSLTEILKEKLNLDHLTPVGKTGKGGCISEARAYDCDFGRIFVKTNSDVNSKVMLDGELESLKALAETQTIRVPNPIAVILIDEKTACFVAEFLELKSLHKFQGQLGRQLAELHLHNQKKSEGKIEKFGFHVTTCCGRIPLDNSWNDSWIDFFCKQRLEPQIQMALKNCKDARDLEDLWIRLKDQIPKLFENIQVFPSLLHGDLWSGNAGEITAAPVIFDPASFYGHHEFDLSIANMFGGFTAEFYKEYHKIIPKQEGFVNRQQLYELFHYLNHWNHFGSSYRGKTLSIMLNLVNTI